MSFATVASVRNFTATSTVAAGFARLSRLTIGRAGAKLRGLAGFPGLSSVRQTDGGITVVAEPNKTRTVERRPANGIAPSHVMESAVVVPPSSYQTDGRDSCL